MTKPPDLCKYVFVCALGDWQIQAAPRARSDVGGHAELFQAIAEAHRDHCWTDHSEADWEAMRKALVRVGAPDNITRPAEGHQSGMMGGVPLPRWWVDR